MGRTQTHAVGRMLRVLPLSIAITVAIVLTVLGSGVAFAGPESFVGSPNVTLDVSPNDGNFLFSPANIIVTGSGFGSTAVTGFLIECSLQPTNVDACTAPIGTFTATTSGTFSTTVTVTETFTDPSVGTINCSATPCTVQAMSDSGQYASQHHISFGGTAQPTLSTSATPSATAGQPISDSATLSNGNNPGGTITFNVYGPNNGCAGVSAFTSTVPVNQGNSTYNSAPFTPSAPGNYNWIASYSGDPNNLPVQGACGEPGETSTVNALPAPTLSTSATPTATVGQPISDSATLSNGNNPGGTITFNVYGPNNTTCAGTPAFTSTVPVNQGNSTYNSAPFTPSAPGNYNWIASYSGDPNNAPVAGACGDAGETSTVNSPPPDCAVTSITFDSQWVHEHQQQVQVQGGNVGTVQARCKITLRARKISAGPAAPVYPGAWFRTLAPGGTFNVYFEVTPPVPGTYRVTACARAVNSSGAIIDGNSTNNCKTATRTAT